MDREKEYVWTRLHFFQFDENNPKEHNYSEIENSIKRFGFIELPVVNKVTNTLVAGHGRIAALQNMAGRGGEKQIFKGLRFFIQREVPFH